jgi:hypothetical protein
MTLDKLLISLTLSGWLWFKCPDGLKDEWDRRDNSRNEKLFWY